jgi:hypothetical protein
MHNYGKIRKIKVPKPIESEDLAHVKFVYIDRPLTTIIIFYLVFTLLIAMNQHKQLNYLSFSSQFIRILILSTLKKLNISPYN